MAASYLRYWPQDNFPIPVAQLQHDWIVDLDRMLFPVDADDEINGRWLFRHSLDRRRGRYGLFRRVGRAR